ncbi:MAG: GtrA family protein [Coriobacteriia bacterium]|nr:GtrA family protein [Coriobacteriia bacterium]
MGANRAFRFGVARYLVVAVIAAAADTGTLFVLVQGLGIHYAPAAAVAFLVGLMVNFVLARRWVFGPTALPLSAEFGAYAAIGVAGVLLTEAVLFIGIDLVGAPLAASKAAALAIVFAWNYLARKHLVYARKVTA